MPVDPAAVGTTGEPERRTWAPDDCILYALAVGTGAADPCDELWLTTENSAGVDQQVLPTFAAVLARRTRDALRRLGDVDPTRVVHGGQAIELHEPLEPQGTAEAQSQIVEISDKGSGALVVVRTDLSRLDGRPWVTAHSTTFLRGEGGFDPGRVRSGPRPSRPEHPPDREVRQRTRPEQALLYRLTGDRNPLHSDPSFAQRAGFERPILHGLCTFGFAGRAAARALSEDRSGMLRGIRGRFSAPVWPGDELRTLLWFTEDGVDFVVERGDGTTAIEGGHAW